MSQNKLPLDPTLYRETLAQLKLHRIALQELHLQCQNPVQGEINITIAGNAKALHQDNELRITSDHKITARNETDELFFINATFVVTLSAPDELPEAFIDIYIDNNLGLTVFPYVRELISSMVSRMGLPPLTLPYIQSQYNKAQDKPKRKPRKKKAVDE